MNEEEFVPFAEVELLSADSDTRDDHAHSATLRVTTWDGAYRDIRLQIGDVIQISGPEEMRV